LKIFSAAAEPAGATERPGTITGERAGALRIAAGNGYLLLNEVQLEGKKRMAAGDFLRGHRVVAGQLLG
jgi:methionyl-tRNA formyltransferase